MKVLKKLGRRGSRKKTGRSSRHFAIAGVGVKGRNLRRQTKKKGKGKCCSKIAALFLP